ncbi:MAG TPA: CHRD domain-containing protein [Acetobacteraceae bacterium]|nr:CHRD domain-containing protein [Acetobacteraceae bacterium]
MSLPVSRRAVLGTACLAWVAGAGIARAAPRTIKLPLSGDQQVPPLKVAGTGMATITYDPDTRVVSWSITYSGLTSPVTMAHFHGPAPLGKNGPVVIWLTHMGSAAPSPITGETTLTPAQAEQFAAGLWYVNVHTQDNPAGEIRGQVVWPRA